MDTGRSEPEHIQRKEHIKKQSFFLVAAFIIVSQLGVSKVSQL